MGYGAHRSQASLFCLPFDYPRFFDWGGSLYGLRFCIAAQTGISLSWPSTLDNAQLKLGCLRPGITPALISSMWMCLLFYKGLCDEPPNVLLDRVGTGKSARRSLLR